MTHQKARVTYADLQEENARLKALLEANQIEWREFAQPEVEGNVQGHRRLSTEQKVDLFRRLFRGREDLFPVRWQSKASGKAGYSPACSNEWLAGVCEKPRMKCADCGNRQFVPLSDSVFYDHLAGEHTIGVYPMLTDETCHFLAADFDDADWRQDVSAFRQSCEDLGVPVSIEISRSGSGAHAWIFFAERPLARDARRLGTAIISNACSKTRQLKLESYDRLFPNQDVMPKGGFGNLIALPLQKTPRESGCSVFVDADFRSYQDQWTYLASVVPMPTQDIEPTILRATGGVHPLDVTFIDEEDLKEPWKKAPIASRKLTGPLPSVLIATLSNLIYFEKKALPQALANRLIRLAAFQNPEFFKAQAMRFSVWDVPRVIGCAENFPNHIGLPRGCLDAARELLRDNGIQCELVDERSKGSPLDLTFAGKLRMDQEVAVREVAKHDAGVLCAPTAFGKTVTAAALIAKRGVNTLILVHRTELLKQWQERLQAFLTLDKGYVGVIGGGKSKPTGKIDIAVMQSLSRQGEVNPIVESYGQVIIDECHHVGAVSFDAILKRVKAKYVLGLTATPIRRDGQQPIIFMQCGPIRHAAARPLSAPQDLEVVPRYRDRRIETDQDVGIQEIFKALADKDVEPFVLHGRMSKKQRSTLVETRVVNVRFPSASPLDAQDCRRSANPCRRDCWQVALQIRWASSVYQSDLQNVPKLIH